jgi:hypothetical protein
MIKKILLFLCLLLLVILFALFLVFKNETTGQCARFEEMARRQNVQTALEYWVNSNVDDTKIDVSELIRSSGISPGYYELNRQFDWRLLDIDPDKGQVRVILARNERGDFDFNDIQSVSFTDRSRVSILVRTSKSRSYGILDKKYLTKVSPSIAVYCAW